MVSYQDHAEQDRYDDDREVGSQLDPFDKCFHLDALEGEEKSLRRGAFLRGRTLSQGGPPVNKDLIHESVQFLPSTSRTALLMMTSSILFLRVFANAYIMRERSGDFPFSQLLSPNSAVLINISGSCGCQVLARSILSSISTSTPTPLMRENARTSSAMAPADRARNTRSHHYPFRDC